MVLGVAAAISALLAGGWFFGKKAPAETVREVAPVRATIQSVISTTGTVLPMNRLEIKPPVAGRAEQILVQEGSQVTAGQVLAWMSSTERAALIDAARAKGEETLAYWQEAYKAIPLISPINGEVIVSKTQPGQSLAATDAVIVLSDHLIARAQVDETDIGKIKLGQEAVIILDAYPGQRIPGRVEHIYYESKTVNNVTIYEVDIIPDTVPGFFRSGMNASIECVVSRSERALLVPQEAVMTDKDGSWVLVKDPGAREPARRSVKRGISDDKNVEIISGLHEKEVLVVRSKKYALPKTEGGTNPFAPRRR